MAKFEIPIAADRAAFRQAIKTIDTTVPLRTEGRKTEHTESWVISRLLYTLDSYDRLTFPLAVRHQDKPDFLLLQNERSVGIEVTEAIPEQYAAFAALAEREFPDTFLEPGHFRTGATRKTNEEMREILRQNRLTAPPWEGDSAEHEWATHIEQTIRTKHVKLQKDDFTKYEENWLAIYVNLPLPFVHLQKASLRLRPLITDLWSHSPMFERIFVEHGPVIMEISANGTAHLSLFAADE
jgi:hypothetical protein